MQLHPNSYAYLHTLFIAYREILGVELTFDDVHFFYNFKHRTRETPSFCYFESVPKRKIISTPFSSKAGDSRLEWFYIKQQSGCARRWTKSSKALIFWTRTLYTWIINLTCFPFLFAVDNPKQISDQVFFDRMHRLLNGDQKFLTIDEVLKDEYLHFHGLLSVFRSIGHGTVPYAYIPPVETVPEIGEGSGIPASSSSNFTFSLFHTRWRTG